MTASPMALQSQILKVKSVKIPQMEHQNAENVAPAIVMDVIAENATPTATVTTRKIYKPIKLCKMFKHKKTHQQRALTLTVPQAPLLLWTERPKRLQLHPQRQSQSQYQSQSLSLLLQPASVDRRSALAWRTLLQRVACS